MSFGPARSARLAAAFCALCAVAAAASAQDPRRSEWRIGGGFGWTIATGPTDPDLQYVALFPELAWPVKPHIAYTVTGHFSRWFPRQGWIAGVLPAGGRLDLLRGRTTAPYVEAGVGVAWTDLTELDEIDRRFNFLAQWGAGVRRRTSGGGEWFGELRYFHVSNFGTAGNNWGLNTLIVVMGTRL
jgi:hypothetical protein